MGKLKKTSLNKKIFVYFCLQTLIVLIVVNFFGYYSITNNIINLHLKRNKEELIRIVNQIDNEMRTVQHILKDYSSWNDAVDYVNYKRNNENAMYCLEFEKSELSGTAIDQTGREIVMVIDNNKEILYELNKNGLGSEQMNIPIEIKNYAFSEGIIESLDHVNAKNGIINTQQGIFFMGIYPILNNRGEGEKNGAMLMAKEIQIDNLKEYLPDFMIKSVGNISKDIKNQKNIVETNSIGSVEVEVFKEGIVNNKIYAKAYIKDITGNNMFEIELKNTGINLKYNITSLTLLFILIFILYILIMFCTWKFFNENFISRVQNILTSLKNIDNEIVITSVENQHCNKDELDIVENNINLMMEKIDSHYDEILEKSKYDNLTKLYNRLGFNEEVKKYLEENKYCNYSIILLDIDKFKNINDVYGHKTGDELIKQISKRLKVVVSTENVLARTSGDEFVIFIPKFNSEDTIHNIAKKLVKNLSYDYKIQKHNIDITVSIGIAFYQNGESVENIISYADCAMYNVKRNGRNNYIEYNEDMKNTITSISINKGIEKNEFFMVYQPQINSLTNKLEGLESLVRWKHDKLGFIPPDKFIEVAEESGSIHKLGEYIIEEVFKQINIWKERQYDIPKISINISPLQFTDDKFYSYVESKIKKYNISTKDIVFEITENYSIGEENKIFENISKFYNIGIEIYIDDFGKGYSALSYLETIPTNGLKIDKSFVNRIEDNDKIVKMVFALSKALNLKVVVEGVETISQKNKICEIGSCIIQGYLYSKPLKVNEVESKYFKGD